MSSGAFGKTNAPAPKTAVEIGVIDAAGKLQGVSATNPLPISGSIVANNPSVGPIASPIPAQATLAGMDVGGVLEPMTGTGTSLNVNVTNAGGGVIGVNQGAPNTPANAWPIKVTDGTNVAGVTAPSAAAVAAQPAEVVALSPNSPLPAGANAIGSVSVSNFPATQPISGTVTANQGTAAATASAWPIKVTDGTNVAGVAPASTAATAVQPAEVVALSPNSPLPAGTNAIGGITGTGVAGTPATGVVTVQGITGGTLVNTIIPDITTTGTITSTQSVTIALNDTSTVGVQVTGVWSGTLVFEVSIDNGVTYNSTTMVVLPSGTLATVTSSNIAGNIQASGFSQVRIRGNTVASGTATVFLRGNATTANVMLNNSIPAGTNTIGTVIVGSTTGRTSVLLFNNNNITTNITTGAYTAIRGAVGGAINLLYIADTSGSSFIIATEAGPTDQLYIGPGGNDAPYQLAIPAATAISVKALSANMASGALTITGLS